MIPSTLYTCNLYPREVWSRFKPSFIPFGPRTSSRTERFQSRDAKSSTSFRRNAPTMASPKPQTSSLFPQGAQSTLPGRYSARSPEKESLEASFGWFAGEEVSFTEMVEKRTRRVRFEVDGVAKDARTTPAKNHDGKTRCL